MTQKLWGDYVKNWGKCFPEGEVGFDTNSAEFGIGKRDGFRVCDGAIQIGLGDRDDAW